MDDTVKGRRGARRRGIDPVRLGQALKLVPEHVETLIGQRVRARRRLLVDRVVFAIDAIPET